MYTLWLQADAVIIHQYSSFWESTYDAATKVYIVTNSTISHDQPVFFDVTFKDLRSDWVL